MSASFSSFISFPFPLCLHLLWNLPLPLPVTPPEDTPLQIITDSDDESSALGSDGEETSSGGTTFHQHNKSSSKLTNNGSNSNHTKNNHIHHSLSDSAKSSGEEEKFSLSSSTFESIGKDLDLLPPLPLLSGSGLSPKDYQLLVYNRQLKILVTKEVKRPGRSECFFQ